MTAADTHGLDTQAAAGQPAEAAAPRQRRDLLDQGPWPALALGLAVCQALTAAVLLVSMLLRDTVPVALALDADGRAIPIHGKEDAGEGMEVDVMLAWTVATVTKALDIGFDDWEARIEGMRGRFTEAGFRAYEAVLERSLVLERLRRQRQVVSAVAQGVPVMVRLRKLADGTVGYEVEFPLLLTFYAGEGERADERLAARALVVRVPRSERLSGIAIADFLLARKAEGRR
ncbi:MAG: hypothetical protein F4X35_00645 [Alphaproteobacteria bacterium]|nr:hypothetical protein [Alphaproteobacteria bacterium]